MTNFEEKTYRVFEFLGKSYSGTDSKNQRYVEYLFEGLKSEDLTKMNVLDLGCASGGTLFNLIEKGIRKGTGVERDNRKLELAKKIVRDESVTNLIFVNREIEKFLLESKEKFELILLLNILHHLPNPFTTIDNICKASSDLILLETPRSRWYEPYDIDRNISKEFCLPPSQKVLIKRFERNNFSVVWKNLSPRVVKFQRGRRSLYLLKKDVTKSIEFDEISKLDSALILGPGASGKTFLIRRLLNLGEESSLSQQKLKKSNENQSSFDFGLNKFMYIPPTWKSPRLSFRLKSFEWQYKAFVESAVKSKRIVIVCFVNETTHLFRIEERLHSRYLSCFDAEKRDQIISTLQTRRSSIYLQASLIRIMGFNHFLRHRRILRIQYFGNLNFSYIKLFRYLRAAKVNYFVYDSGAI